VCTEIDTLKEDMLWNVKTKFLFNRINNFNLEKIEKREEKTTLYFKICLSPVSFFI